MEDNSLAAQIKRARKQKGLTQEELATKSGVTYTSLSKIESGQVTNPTINTLRRIFLVLDLSLDSIFNLDSADDK